MYDQIVAVSKKPDHSNLEFHLGIPGWNSNVEFHVRHPTWNSKVEFQVGSLTWNSTLEFQVGIRSLHAISSTNFI